MCQKQEKNKIIKALTLKRKMKCHYTKRDDGISTASKKYIDSLFSFSANKILSFSISRMNTKESSIEKS
jgi:hypothetical protein